jgi:hypothetical protein
MDFSMLLGPAALNNFLVFLIRCSICKSAGMWVFSFPCCASTGFNIYEFVRHL